MPNIFQPSLSNTPTSKTISENATVTPYATDLLQRGQAFTTAETPVYEGQLTTGPSQYQNQAWQGLANLTVPKNITEAGNQLGNISTQQQGLTYNPGNITNTYNPAAGNYKPIDVTAGAFGTEEAQKYMNPYIQQALDPQLEYMRRQAAINQQSDMAKLAQAGAFGGSRQAILQGQNQEALMRQQAATTGQGYQQAFSQAQQQFNADQQRQMEATKANIQQAQIAAQMGMSDAEMMARYGMDAQKANEASRQFAAGYRQQALSNAANTEQARAQAGGLEAQYGLANLNALSAAGAQQQAIEQAALDAQYKEYLRQTEYPAKQLEQMKGLITAMAPVTPETKTIYGQKEATAKTAAGFLGAAAGALGIKTLDDLKKKAAEYGLTSENFKKMLGITPAMEKNAPDTSNPASTGQTGLPSSETGSGYTPDENGLSAPAPGYHRDADGNLVKDGEETMPSPDFEPSDVGPELTEDNYAGIYAQGGLIDLLHKMRGHK
jgi:hypothetical protein